MQHWTDKILRASLSLWVGGLVTIDLVETPARFRTPELNRNQVLAVGREVFSAVNRSEALLGAIALPASLSGPRWRTALVGAMYTAALVQMGSIRPRITALSQGLDFVNRDPDDPRYAQIRPLHKAYTVLDILKIALGLPALLSRP